MCGESNKRLMHCRWKGGELRRAAKAEILMRRLITEYGAGGWSRLKFARIYGGRIYYCTDQNLFQKSDRYTVLEDAAQKIKSLPNFAPYSEEVGSEILAAYNYLYFTCTVLCTVVQYGQFPISSPSIYINIELSTLNTILAMSNSTLEPNCNLIRERILF